MRDALLVLAVTGVLVAWFARPRRDPVSWSPERRMLAELGTGGSRVTTGVACSAFRPGGGYCRLVRRHVGPHDDGEVQWTQTVDALVKEARDA